jgi:hypothetical protein
MDEGKQMRPGHLSVVVLEVVSLFISMASLKTQGWRQRVSSASSAV